MQYAALTPMQKTEANNLALATVLDELTRYVTNPELTPPAGAAATVTAVRNRVQAVATSRDYLAPVTVGDSSTVWLGTANDQQ